MNLIIHLSYFFLYIHLYIFGGPLLNPMIGAAAMSCSSVSVLLNALRLKKFKA